MTAKVTVFEDQEKFNSLHPLQHEWVLWYDSPNKRINSQNWSQNLKEVVEISTVEEFWGVINNVVSAIEIPFGANFHLFKKGIKPMWEDPANAHGGKWSFNFGRTRGDNINEVWINTLLGAIGETFEDHDNICGLVFSNRRVMFKIGLWVKSNDDKVKNKETGAHFKRLLGLGENDSLEYQPHDGGHGDNSQKLVV
ncbi:Eukaryotic translation initiation factor 4E [Zancudomyces culisetae]|uniref:Eukaryotic translation initiation factor 4E n=1 Tax=Zancudomyces culisetae TaxID=1213189 RepID=A0A1R1PX41_ZANCU|nr:Eukaryotic translation initiation factor 4E [Zancudomyces culisetae]|eukprot:OMH85556.1 Eukaryotic translation initiation factor 4E [Zancudomyces culisetae]